MSADLESVIAGVLAGHWSFSTDTDDYPRFVDRCDGCHEIVFNHGREDNQNQSYAAHQARAVLDAISAAGFDNQHEAFAQGQKSGMRHADRLAAANKIGRPDLPGPLSPNPYPKGTP